MRDREIECTDAELDALAKAIAAEFARDMEAEAGAVAAGDEEESTRAWVARVKRRYGIRGRVAWILGKGSVVQ